MDRSHSGKIDDEAVVAKRAAAHVVATAANGGQKIVCASEIDSVDDVCDTRAAGDEPGAFVNAGVPDPARVS